jgi:hypothetical protein
MENTSNTFEKVWAEIQRERPVPVIISEEEAEFNRKIRKAQERRYYFDDNGSLCYDGFYTEEFFLTALKYGKRTYFGEKFDDIETQMKGMETDDIFGIAMLNEGTVAIVETKFKAHENDIPKVLKKANTFRINFPDYQNHKIYLGLATMAFYPELEEKCTDNGIAIIKQVGDTVVINDKHVKAF